MRLKNIEFHPLWLIECPKPHVTQYIWSKRANPFSCYINLKPVLQKRVKVHNIHISESIRYTGNYQEMIMWEAMAAHYVFLLLAYSPNCIQIHLIGFHLLCYCEFALIFTEKKNPWVNLLSLIQMTVNSYWSVGRY